ncbi:MAG: Opine dehydrogenase [Anaerolineales bacterium]|nr:Opine dehydrogenase [Anaerolineales bacterium]
MMQVTVCGGGNGAHALVSLIGARQDWTVNVYAPYGDEAERWRKAVAVRGGVAAMTSDGTLVGQPARISADPAKVVPGSQLVLLALPAFAHEIMLRDIALHLGDNVWIGALPARGGFDWCVEDVLSSGELTSAPLPLCPSALFGLQTLPWACRLTRYGQEVEILGTKAVIDLATQPTAAAGDITTLLGEPLGVRLEPVASFLSLTLANTGQLIHPGIMYGLFHDWDGRPYDEAPFFYQGVDAEIAGVLQQLSDEVQAVRAELERRYPDLDLSAVRPLDEWVRRSYAGDIADPSSLQSCFNTNRSYAGLRAPIRNTSDGLMPDFRARYLAEDVPCGLAVTRGIAELADVETPMMDEVITWAQERVEKEYLVDGRLQGRDVAATRAPQRYGFETLNDLGATNEFAA